MKLVSTFGFVTLAFALAVGGGTLGAVLGTSHKRLCALISLGAGTLMGVTLFAILPETMEVLRTWQLVLALVSGYLVFAVISKYIFHVCPACAASHFDDATTHRFSEIASAMMIALAIHCTVDGLAMSAGGEADGASSSDLAETFEDKAQNKDAVFTNIMSRYQQLKRARPQAEFSDLLEAIGTNNITAYFPADDVRKETDPARAILDDVQKDAAGAAGRVVVFSIILAVCVHKIPEGLALGALLRGAGLTTGKILFYVLAVEATTLLGGLLGWLFFPNASSIWVSVALAHAGGGFIFLATHAIIGEILKHHKTLVLTCFGGGVGLIGGFVLLLRLLH